MSTKTWSAAPFVSKDYDKSDESRAEVKVVLGYGTIADIEPSKAGKANKISFTVSNTEHNPSGWIQVAETELMDMIERAKEEGTPIHFRLETRRKEGIDRSTPISELTDLSVARKSINKAVAALKFAEGDDWTFSVNAVTNPKEDPNTGGNGIHSALHMDIPEKTKESSSAKAPVHYGVEPPPYITYNKNGDLNPGSIAVSVPLNLYSYIADYERANSEALQGFTDKERTGLVKVMLDIANKMQLAIYEGEAQELEAPDLSLGSHTRARAIMFELIRSDYPITHELVEDAESRKEWAKSILERGVKMWKWSMKLV